MMPTASAPVSAAAAQSYRAGRHGVAVVPVVLEVASAEPEVASAEPVVQGRTVVWAVQAGSLAVVVPTPDPG